MTVLISVVFRVAALTREEALLEGGAYFNMDTKSATLIRGRRLSEARLLLVGLVMRTFSGKLSLKFRIRAMA